MRHVGLHAGKPCGRRFMQVTTSTHPSPSSLVRSSRMPACRCARLHRQNRRPPRGARGSWGRGSARACAGPSRLLHTHQRAPPSTASQLGNPGRGRSTVFIAAVARSGVRQRPAQGNGVLAAQGVQQGPEVLRGPPRYHPNQRAAHSTHGACANSLAGAHVGTRERAYSMSSDGKTSAAGGRRSTRARAAGANKTGYPDAAAGSTKTGQGGAAHKRTSGAPARPPPPRARTCRQQGAPTQTTRHLARGNSVWL